MRFTNLTKCKLPICLAIYGCSSLELVSEFINEHPFFIDKSGYHFTSGQLAGQYAFEQVKLDRKGYESRRLQKSLSILADAGAIFSIDEALSHADELINHFTADFGHDEDGEATFRIKAQSYRLKKYDCQALWERVIQSQLIVQSISPGNFDAEESEDDENISEDDELSFTIRFTMLDPLKEPVATLSRYLTVTNGKLQLEDFVDYTFTDYPNFHDESQTMQTMMEAIAKQHNADCLAAVLRYAKEHNLRLPDDITEDRNPLFDASNVLNTPVFLNNKLINSF